MNAPRLDIPKQNTARYAVKAVLFALAAAFFALLPAVISGGGALLLRDDFNYQQIIFQMLMGDFYKSGNFGWSSVTDLGSGVIGSFSFYNLASPFTLLTAFLPAEIIPYTTAPVLIIKYCVAALTAFFFIKRFVKNYDTAVFGAVLYAFCGFQTVNLMFPFHDVTALFPLLLIGVEEVVEKKKFGALAFASALCCLTNYYFFFGQIIFLAIYFIFRFIIGKALKGELSIKRKGSIPKTFGNLGLCLLEGLLGAGIAAIILLPSALSVLDNPRLDSSVGEVVYHWTRYFTIAQGFFLPADVMGTQGYFLEKACTSCSLCLPFVAMAFVFSFVLKNKKSGFTWLGATICVVAAVPFLNSAFSLFNAQYYARWYYMAALIFALMSAMALDGAVNDIPNADNEKISARKALSLGAVINAVITVIIVAAEFLLVWYFTAAEHPYLEKIDVKTTALYGVFAILCCGILLLILRIKTPKRLIAAITFTTLAVSAVTTGAGALRYKNGGVEAVGADGVTVNSDSPLSAEQTLEIYNGITAEALGLSNVQNYRVNTAWYGEGLDYYQHSYDNLSMVIDVPSVNGFISTVSGGIFEFYDNLCLDRRVTAPSFDDPALLALLSCRYFLTSDPNCEEAAGKAPVGIYKHGNGETVYCFEYDNFLPMGITYGYYMTTEELTALPAENRPYALLMAAVVDTDFAADMTPFSETDLYRHLSLPEFNVTDSDISAAVSSHLGNAFDAFVYTEEGFYANIERAAAELAYFSVPYDNGWTATVNGKEVDIINSNGMMAVPLDSGYNAVNFTYKTVGLQEGVIISAACLSAAVIYCVAGNVVRKKYRKFHSV